MKLNKVMTVWVNDGSQTNGKKDNSHQIETAHRQAQECYQVKLNKVLALELEMRIHSHKQWKPGDPEWEKMSVKLHNHTYQRALDQLEALVVACIFELTKMNMSQTGK